MYQRALTRSTLGTVLGLSACIYIAGLPPARADQPQATESAARYLPPDPDVVVLVRLGQLKALEAFGPIAPLADAGLAAMTNAPVADIEELFIVADPDAGGQGTRSRFAGLDGLILRATGDFSFEPPKQSAGQELETIPVGESQMRFARASGTAWAQLDARTAVVGKRRFVEATLARESEKLPVIVAAKPWRDLSVGHVVIAARSPALSDLFHEIVPQRREASLVDAALEPMWRNAQHYYAALRCGEKLSCVAVAESKDAAQTTPVEQTLSAALVLTRNILNDSPSGPLPRAGGPRPLRRGAIDRAGRPASFAGVSPSALQASRAAPG